MENLTIKTLRTVDVESEFTLATCFTINQYLNEAKKFILSL